MTNKEVVEKFLNCFGKLDAEGMISCLAYRVIYNNPIYGIIEDEFVRGLWKMRCKNVKDLKLQIMQFDDLDHEYVTCKWTASFFSGSSLRRINMTITSFIRLSEGKIIEHSDAYRLSEWLAKAYGITGVLFGWSGWMKKREQSRYRIILKKFVESQRFFDSNTKRAHDYDFSDR